MKYIVLSGRVLYSLIFLMAILSHFSAEAIGYAASQGVPFASVAVPFSGVMAGLGGLSVALGYRAKSGAWLLVLFLLPVTFMMHNFWAISDPMMARLQQAFFMKNIALLGSALLIAHFGSGPLSLDAVLQSRQARHYHNRKAATV